MCNAALLLCFPEIAVHGVLVHASAPQPCVFPLGFGECWALCLLIVVLLLPFLIARVPAGRVRDHLKCVIWCLCSYLVCGYLTCSSESGFLCWYFSSHWCWKRCDWFWCLLFFFTTHCLLSLKSNVKLQSPYFMETGDTFIWNSLSKENAIWCIVMLFCFLKKLLGVVTLISGPGLRIWCCVMELSQLTV